MRGNLTSLFALLVCIGCSSSSDKYQEAECALGEFESCQIQLPEGGTGTFFLQNLQPDQEYIVAVLNTEPEPVDRVIKSSFRVQAPLSSAGIPDDETLLYQTLLDNAIVSGNPQNSNPPISLPANFRARLLSEIYVPSPDDYQSIQEGVDSLIYVRSDNSSDYSGRVKSPRLLHETEGLYNLQINDEEEFADEKSIETSQCLDQTLPKLFDIIGEPLSVNGYQGLQIFLSTVPSTRGLIAGLFNLYDRFTALNSSPLPDSNFGQYVFVNPNASAESICLTSLHEAQHLLSFDHKVLRQIPELDRQDLSAISDYDLIEEDLGLNEGFSHTIEEIFVPTFETRDQIRRFLTGLSISSRSLRSAYASIRQRLATRGYNTMLVWYALARKGASLHHEDPITAEILRELIQSPDVGLENIGAHFGETEDEYWMSFLNTLLMTIYAPEKQAQLWPSLYEDEESGQLHGLQFVDRNSTHLEIAYNQAHPLYAQIPLMGRSNFETLAPQTHSLLRFIVPQTIPGNGELPTELKITENSASSRIFITRVR